jgi:hypothetical protein
MEIVINAIIATYICLGAAIKSLVDSRIFFVGRKFQYFIIFEEVAETLQPETHSAFLTRPVNFSRSLPRQILADETIGIAATP